MFAINLHLVAVSMKHLTDAHNAFYAECKKYFRESFANQRVKFRHASVV